MGAQNHGLGSLDFAQKTTTTTTTLRLGRSTQTRTPTVLLVGYPINSEGRTALNNMDQHTIHRHPKTPLSSAYLMVGRAASIRAVLVMMLGSFLSWGTLKSTRMKTRLSLRSTSSIFVLAKPHLPSSELLRYYVDQQVNCSTKKLPKMMPAPRLFLQMRSTEILCQCVYFFSSRFQEASASHHTPRSTWLNSLTACCSRGNAQAAHSQGTAQACRGGGAAGSRGEDLLARTGHPGLQLHGAAARGHESRGQGSSAQDRTHSHFGDRCHGIDGDVSRNAAREEPKLPQCRWKPVCPKEPRKSTVHGYHQSKECSCH